MMSPPVELSPWKSAPFSVGGEVLFAVGDVHGCEPELRALLDTVKALASEARPARRRLIYLGDMIDRGPDTIGVLRLWSERAEDRGVDQVERLMGNHEIMMLLSIDEGPQAETFRNLWFAPHTGGQSFLEEMRAACRDRTAPPTYALLAAALGERIARLLPTQRSHLQVGNALFVHAGLDGRKDPARFLASPWTAGREARWAWIRHGFLDWQEGFGGTLVVHGHTPPDKHLALTQMPDPHVLQHDRLNLDGGSARTGIVVAAEIQDGRYRILKTGAP